MAKKKETQRQRQDREKPRVTKELDGFDIQVNSFGEIITTMTWQDQRMSHRNVDDKKLRDREDLESLKRGGRAWKRKKKTCSDPVGGGR
jgi:hypothetical protein